METYNRGGEKQDKEVLEPPKFRLPFHRPSIRHKDKKKEERKKRCRINKDGPAARPFLLE